MTICEWFAKCENETSTTIPHPVLGDVPICGRCARTVGIIGNGSVWDATTLRLASERGTLCAHPDTSAVYWSDYPAWDDPATSVRERPSQWVYVPDGLVARIHVEAQGLRAGEYLAWHGSGLLVCGGPA